MTSEKKVYKGVFFDLDHTLWDYDTNCRNSLRIVYDTFLHPGIDFDKFNKLFININDELWDKFAQGKITREFIRERRFHLIFDELSIKDDTMAALMSRTYSEIGPKQPHLIEGALEILNYAYDKYPIYLITNGFEDIQHVKIRSSSIEHFFKAVITSEGSGYHKPSPAIFKHALDLSGLKNHEVIMIGDNLISDVAGANAALIDIVFYNPHGRIHDSKVTHEIRSLWELTDII